MIVRELINELKKMPQDANVVIQANGMDNEDWMYMTICGQYNMSVGLDRLKNVCIYAEEDFPEED